MGDNVDFKQLLEQPLDDAQNIIAGGRWAGV